MRIALFVLLSVGAAALVLPAWNGWRNGRVMAAGALPLVGREAQPILYWITMGILLLVALGCIGAVAALAFGLLPSPD